MSGVNYDFGLNISGVSENGSVLFWEGLIPSLVRLPDTDVSSGFDLRDLQSCGTTDRLHPSRHVPSGKEAEIQPNVRR